jgi:hypothetical protein
MFVCTQICDVAAVVFILMQLCVCVDVCTVVELFHC